MNASHIYHPVKNQKYVKNHKGGKYKRQLDCSSAEDVVGSTRDDFTKDDDLTIDIVI